MKFNNNLTAEFVRSILDYDPEIGHFTWIKMPGTRSDLIGKKAGTIQKRGYYTIKIKDTLYYAHRLAWLIVTGEWPKEYIDHINGRKDDNRWYNLREATQSENRRNTNSKKNSSSKYKGVYYSKNREKWVVYVSLGSFDTEEEAALRYNDFIKEYHGQFANFNNV